MGSERRRDPSLLDALRRIAPGTELRVAIENIISGHLGALIVLGDTNELQFMFSGGMKVDLPRAAECYRQALKLDPTDAGIHYLLGRCLADLRRTEDALESFEAALQLKPDFPEAQAALCQIAQLPGL